MLRFQHSRERRPALRGALVGALAVTVLFPLACASASSTPHRPATTAPAPSDRVSSTSQAKARKPITVKVTPQLFGVHDASTSMASLSKPGIGSIRLWDSGVKWYDVEPSKGNFHWDRLDQYVEKAHATGTEVMLVLAGTPSWAAASLSDPAGVSDSTRVPVLDEYKNYLTAVMERYKAFDPDHTGHPYRGIANYQVWNEPNIKNFWTGTPQQMADLVQAAWQVRQSVDPGAKIIAPSMVTRLSYELTWIRNFYKLTVGGQPVWKYVNATTYSFYPVDLLPSGRPAGPEDMMNLVSATRAVLAKDGVPKSLPVWNSEVNYGLPTGDRNKQPTPTISDAKQAAFIMRTYLLSAAAGVPRVFWYRYDLHADFANTFMTQNVPAPEGTLTPAGLAFYRAQQWMRGTLVGTPTQRPCAHDRVGTYTCVVRYANGSVGRIYWNPGKTVRVRTVSSTQSWQPSTGTMRKVGHPVRLRVGYAPVLVKSKS